LDRALNFLEREVAVLLLRNFLPPMLWVFVCRGNKVTDQMKAPVNANSANMGAGSLAMPAQNRIKCRTPGK
jgi:hypothetical protein